MKLFKITVSLLSVSAIMMLASSCAPKNYDVKREIVINAPADLIYAQVSQYANFPNWSPWQGLDTAMTTTIEGTDGTVGAKYSWKGNKDVGEGSMTITKLETNKTVEQNLHFLKPFESSSVTYTLLEPTEGGVKVIWGMKGESNMIARIFMTFMGGMDGAVGKDYEKGLAKLKTVCEALPTYAIKEVEWTSKSCLSKREVVTFSEMSSFFGKHFSAMYEAIGKAGATAGIPFGVFYSYDEATQKSDLAACVPFDEKKSFKGDYKVLDLPTRKAYLIEYFGPYEKMKPAYDAMDAKLKELGKTNPEMVIEEYVSDPMIEKDPAKLLTKIYFFVD